MRRAASSLVAILACLLVLGACGDSDSDTESAEAGASSTTGEDGSTTTGDDAGSPTTADDSSETDTTGSEPTSSMPPVTTAAGDKPEVEAGEGDPPAELETEDLVVGTGDEAVAGAPIEVHYVGVLYEDGEQFDSSWDRGSTFDFTLGQGQVIQGWDEGVEGMKVGGRRRIVVPPDLAYGETGAGGIIGPDATLIFVVDLVDVGEPLPDVDPADAPTVEVPDPLPTELTIEDLEEGDGDEATEGTTAVIHVVGVTASDGEVFNSSWETNTPLPVPLGLDQVIPGLEQGIEGMKVGGRRQVVVPPDLAFGEAGNDAIGPDETLVLVIDLVDVR